MLIPAGMLGLAGVTDMEVRVAAVTVLDGEPLDGELPPPPPPQEAKGNANKGIITINQRQFTIRLIVPYLHYWKEPSQE